MAGYNDDEFPPYGHHDDELFGARIEYSLKFHIFHFRKNGVHPMFKLPPRNE